MRLTLLGFFAYVPLQVWGSCFSDAAKTYGVDERLLRAIAHVESAGAPAHVVSKNKNGSRDIGRMQINDTWLKELSKYGIREAELKNECISIMVGAWVMSKNIAKDGELNWNAVGRYNVGCARLAAAECSRRRNLYAWKVYRAMQKQSGATELAGESPALQVVSAQESKTKIGAVDFGQ
jgi:soluble lytic murein transglycosylase-like protein